MNGFDLISILDLLGTFAFAISGIRLASGRNMDWFGAYVIGLVTAIGEGNTRDLLLEVTAFWILDPSYLVTTAAALWVTLTVQRKNHKVVVVKFPIHLPTLVPEDIRNNKPGDSSV